MTHLKQTITYVLFGAAVAALCSCAPTVHDVEVVHTVHHYHSTPPPSTAPQDYGVVNQYDRGANR